MKQFYSYLCVNDDSQTPVPPDIFPAASSASHLFWDFRSAVKFGYINLAALTVLAQSLLYGT